MLSYMYKSVSITIRVSEGEAAILDRRRGSINRSNYLRALIRQDDVEQRSVESIIETVSTNVNDRPHRVPGNPRGGNASSGKKAEDLKPPPTGPAPGHSSAGAGHDTLTADEQSQVVLGQIGEHRHLHKRGRQISTRMVKGSRISVWACADPTCDFEIEG
jgi:hypothetical protein